MTFMPQWDFLDLVADAAAQHPEFTLLRSTRADGLIRDGDRIAGVTGTGPDGDVAVHARLVVDASGRDSGIRAAAGLTPSGVASAMDVLWFRIPETAGERYPFIQAGSGLIIAIDRGDFFQIAHVIPAGAWHGTDADLTTMKDRVVRISPRMADAVGAITVPDVHLLGVRLERLRHWFSDGMLCIGDSAHAKSPAGGVGINLAIQDAVATARILGPVLRNGIPSTTYSYPSSQLFPIQNLHFFISKCSIFSYIGSRLGACPATVPAFLMLSSKRPCAIREPSYSRVPGLAASRRPGVIMRAAASSWTSSPRRCDLPNSTRRDC